jgi:hypothetical protein
VDAELPPLLWPPADSSVEDGAPAESGEDALQLLLV